MAIDPNSAWGGFLEYEPAALWGFYANKGTLPQQDYWSGQYGKGRQDYMGQLARMIQMGKEPTLSWTDFLKNYDWTGQWSGLNPTSRGERPTVYNPARQWNVW